MASVEHRRHRTVESWRVVWREDGQKQTEIFSTADEAEEFRALVEAHGSHWPRGWVKGHGYEADSGVPTFREYAERTIAARLRADDRTKADYRNMLARHVYPRIGHLPVTQVDRFAVATVAQALIAQGKAPKTIANVHGLLSSVLADAALDGLISRNPAVGALPTLPDVKGEEMVFLTGPEFAHLASELPEGLGRDLATLLVGTGLRWSEATALQVRDVDLLGTRQLHVRRAWKRRDNLFVLGEPKTKRSRRSLDLSPELVDLLAGWVAAKDPGEYVFTTDHGHPVRHSNYYNRLWRPALARAARCDAHRDAAAPCGCPGTLTKRPRIHDLRHTHASWLIDAGINLPEIQRRLGHESIQTTVDRYGHPSGAKDAINAAVDRMLVSR